MRSEWRLLYMVALGAFIVSALCIAPAQAQTTSTTRRGYSSSYAMPGLRNHPLTSEQKQRIADIRNDTRRQMMSIQHDTRLTSQERERRLRELRTNQQTRIMAVLTPQQREELRTWQQKRGGGMGREMGRGPGMSYGMDGTPRLTRNPLTRQQRERIMQIQRETRIAVQNVNRDTSLTAQNRDRRIAEIRQRGHARVVDVLTPQQRQELMSGTSGTRTR